MSNLIYLFLFFQVITCFELTKDKYKKLAKEKDVNNFKKDIKLIKQILGIEEILPQRTNVANLELDSNYLNLLNRALGDMKSVTDPNDWTSFENVANYHGLPPMCDSNWNITYPDGDGSRGCCVHHSRPFPLLFAPWHRLYMVNFEQSLKIRSFGSLALPYWDWTTLTETPTGLPALAEYFPEWESGVIKGSGGQVTNRNPGNFFTDTSNIEYLKSLLQLAYCATTYRKYDTLNQHPHDRVHVHVGGSMQRTETASYDPIFYLHHSFIDLQYAYWQELQYLRGLPAFEDNPAILDREMPPFSDYTVNGISVNPILSTKQYDTQRLSLDYKNHFKYEYDQLRFGDLTPQQFIDQNAARCNQEIIQNIK